MITSIMFLSAQFAAICLLGIAFMTNDTWLGIAGVTMSTIAGVGQWITRAR